MLPTDSVYTNVLTINTTLTVLEDQRYTAVVSFSNLAEEFNITSEISFCKNIMYFNKIFDISNVNV